MASRTALILVALLALGRSSTEAQTPSLPISVRVDTLVSAKVRCAEQDRRGCAHAGAFGAWAIGRGLRATLNDVQPGDPSVFATTAAAMLVVALLASVIPARAAGRLRDSMSKRRSNPGVVLAWLLAVLAAVPASGQSSSSAADANVRGRVVDAPSMEGIAGASVVADGKATMADKDGRFVLTVPRGAIRLVIAADGYLADQVDLVVADRPLSVEVLLLRQEQFKEEVTVTGAAVPIARPPATIEVSPLQVRSIAGAADNIFRVLQTLPGVNATADFDSRIAVRGGGPDQNLTVMDGVEIHNPYRLFGLTSAFNPETVENFELTAGGFSPKYGDRLSSLLVVENRAGTRTRGAGRMAEPRHHRRQRDPGREAAGVDDRIVAFHGAPHVLRPGGLASHRLRAAGVRRPPGQGRVGDPAGPARDPLRLAEPRNDRRVVQRQFERKQPRPQGLGAQRPGFRLVLLDHRLPVVIGNRRVLVSLLGCTRSGRRRAQRGGAVERARRRGFCARFARYHARRHGPRRLRATGVELESRQRARPGRRRRRPRAGDRVGLGDQGRSQLQPGERIERARRGGPAGAARFETGLDGAAAPG